MNIDTESIINDLAKAIAALFDVHAGAVTIEAIRNSTGLDTTSNRRQLYDTEHLTLPILLRGIKWFVPLPTEWGARVTGTEWQWASPELPKRARRLEGSSSVIIDVVIDPSVSKPTTTAAGSTEVSSETSTRMTTLSTTTLSTTPYVGQQQTVPSETSPSVLCPGTWAEWSPCSVSCGSDAQRRRTFVVYHIDNSSCSDANPNSVQVAPCDFVPCPLDCLGYWSSWAECDASCGRATATRRFIVTQEPTNGGLSCAVEGGATQSTSCHAPPCGNASATRMATTTSAHSIQLSTLSGVANDCQAPFQHQLLYGVDAYLADTDYNDGMSMPNFVCCHNDHNTEPVGFFMDPAIDLFGRLELQGANASDAEPTVFFDSTCGVPLFAAPVQREFDQWKMESEGHGWLSFRGAEVVSSSIVVSNSGEVRSICGTHLGHNYPDGSGNRYSIDVVCIAGQGPAASALTTSFVVPSVATSSAISQAVYFSTSIAVVPPEITTQYVDEMPSSTIAPAGPDTTREVTSVAATPSSAETTASVDTATAAVPAQIDTTAASSTTLVSSTDATTTQSLEASICQCIYEVQAADVSEDCVALLVDACAGEVDTK